MKNFIIPFSSLKITISVEESTNNYVIVPHFNGRILQVNDYHFKNIHTLVHSDVFKKNIDVLVPDKLGHDIPSQLIDCFLALLKQHHDIHNNISTEDLATYINEAILVRKAVLEAFDYKERISDHILFYEYLSIATSNLNI